MGKFIYGFKMWEAFYSQTIKPQAIKRNSNKHVHIKILNFFIEEIPQTRPKKKTTTTNGRGKIFTTHDK